MSIVIFANFIILLATLLVTVISFFKRKFTYWKRKGVPTLNPTIPFGDLQNFVTRKVSRMEEFAVLYNKVKAKGKYSQVFFSSIETSGTMNFQNLFK